MNNSELVEEYIGLATGADIENIIKLQKENLHHNLSEVEKSNGFLFLENTHEDLKKILCGDGVMVVCKNNNELLGYLFSINLDYAKSLHFFSKLIESLENIDYEGKNINEYKYCILGQVCVKKDFRGKGILEKLYTKIKEELVYLNYDIAVSEIAENNTRSISANLGKIGLKNIGHYTSNGVQWLIVVLDL